MKTSIALDCNTCRTPGSMIATKIPKFSGIVRLIGVILVLPSLAGMGFAGLLLIAFLVISANSSAARTDAELGGQIVGSAFVLIIILAVAAVSLVGGLVGWLLLMMRKVFKCRRCGFVLDRD